MPWNEPGQSGNQDPWKGKNNSSPPDLDKLIGDLIKKLRLAFSFKKNDAEWKSTTPSKKDHRFHLGVGAAIVILLWFLSGFFIVNPAEETVVLRFGKYTETMQPGLHWIARFIDSKYTLDVQKIYSFPLQGDFITKSSDQNDLATQYVQVDTNSKASIDQSKNLVNVELNVQYKISNPNAYLFNIVGSDRTVQQIATSALSDVVGQMKLDEVLTTGRELVSLGVFDRTKKVLNSYDSGVEVVAVTLRKIQAPDQVRSAFSDVNRADQDRSTTIQQAQAYASKVVPVAQGAAARILADANAYEQQVVLTAQANVAKYAALQKAYLQSPDVTRERMYLESMQNIFTHTTKILVDFNTSNNMIYLPLDKIMHEVKQTETSADDAHVSIPSSFQSAAAIQTEVKNDAN